MTFKGGPIFPNSGTRPKPEYCKKVKSVELSSFRFCIPVPDEKITSQRFSNLI